MDKMQDVSRWRILFGMAAVTACCMLTALFIFNGESDGRFFTLFWKSGLFLWGSTLGLIASYITMRFKITDLSPPFHVFARAVYVIGGGLCMCLGG